MTKRLLILAFIIALLLTAASLLIKNRSFDDGAVSSIGILTSYSVALSSDDQSTICSGVNLSHYQKSGWPMRFESRNLEYPGCDDALYPLIIIIDFVMYFVLFLLGFKVLNTIRHRKS